MPAAYGVAHESVSVPSSPTAWQAPQLWVVWR